MAFPASTWAFLPWGAGKLDEATIAERKTGLQSWLNSVLGTFPNEPAVRRFLCEAPAADTSTEPDPDAAGGRSVESPVVGRMAVALWAFEPPVRPHDTAAIWVAFFSRCQPILAVDRPARRARTSGCRKGRRCGC